jgi:H+/Cl- antiporter ClcA
MPRRILLVALAWMLLLTAAFFVWINVDGFRDLLPETLGPLPPETIWFGAVGGMLISFAGIYRYNCRWDSCFDYWHYTRPLLGAFMGVLGCLSLIILTKASTTNVQLETDATFYSLVALVIGYREESFRTLLSRVTDLFLLPGRLNDRANDGAPRAT